MEKFDKEQLAMGIKVEMEHTNDPKIAEKIAKDHLRENPKYYSILKKSGLADELNEIERTTSLRNDSRLNYDQFIDWASNKTKKLKVKEKSQYNGYSILEGNENDTTFLIIYEAKNPIGYLALTKFNDGYFVETVGVKPSQRGKGISTILYYYVLNQKKYKLYSGDHQTPEARKMWVSFSKKFNMLGYSDDDKKTFKVKVNNDGTEMESDDSNYKLYFDKHDENKQKTYLVISDGINENIELKKYISKIIFETLNEVI